MTKEDKKVQKKIAKIRFVVHALNDTDLTLMYCILMDEVTLRDMRDIVLDAYNKYIIKRYEENR